METHVETGVAVRREDAMVAELRGVPRSALQAVFGNVLGRRIWEDCRSLVEAKENTKAGSGNGPIFGRTADAVTDPEIVEGMIRYVCRRAGDTLRQRGRQAKAIGLQLLYGDGSSILTRIRLARPTNDALELAAAAIELFGKLERSGVPVESVDLKVTSVLTETVGERVASLDYAMAGMARA